MPGNFQGFLKHSFICKLQTILHGLYSFFLSGYSTELLNGVRSATSAGQDDLVWNYCTYLESLHLTVQHGIHQGWRELRRSSFSVYKKWLQSRKRSLRSVYVHQLSILPVLQGPDHYPLRNVAKIRKLLQWKLANSNSVNLTLQLIWSDSLVPAQPCILERGKTPDNLNASVSGTVSSSNWVVITLHRRSLPRVITVCCKPKANLIYQTKPCK